MKEVLDIEIQEIKGYKFINDEKAWELYYATGGEKIDTLQIDFTSIIEDFEESQNEKK